MVSFCLEDLVQRRITFTFDDTILSIVSENICSSQTVNGYTGGSVRAISVTGKRTGMVSLSGISDFMYRRIWKQMASDGVELNIPSSVLLEPGVS